MDSLIFLSFSQLNSFGIPMIDLRSDTITRPTPAMREAMMRAEVGDDVFGLDPTVNAFQERVAYMFGKEAALYCPSGTMTNQIAMRVLTDPQDEVVCHKHSHVFLYEGGGMMYNSMLSPKLLEGDRGLITAHQVSTSINPDDIHFPKTSLVVIENTMNKGGGAIYNLKEIRNIRKVCDANGLNLHLDGARLFNALVETGDRPQDYGALFDTLSICFSKGLGAPVGSVLLGSESVISKARRVRKVMGGGMRQAGYLAAACDYALTHHIARLKDDHRRARSLAEEATQLAYVEKVFPVETNIVILELTPGQSEQEVLAQLAAGGLHAVGFGPGLVRLVTHLDFDDRQLDHAVEILKSIQ